MYLLQRSVPALGLTTRHSRLVVGFNSAGLALATVAVLLRVYARRLNKKAFVSEDYLVFLALVFYNHHARYQTVSNAETAGILRPGYSDILRFGPRMSTETGARLKNKPAVVLGGAGHNQKDVSPVTVETSLKVRSSFDNGTRHRLNPSPRSLPPKVSAMELL